MAEGTRRIAAGEGANPSRFVWLADEASELVLNQINPNYEYRNGYGDVNRSSMLYLGGLGGGATVFSRTLSPYLFTGLGITGGDSAGVNVVHNGWSYGAGAGIPLGLDADLFAEARWRMNAYVLPTAKGAPDTKSELRFGLSWVVGQLRVLARGVGRR